MPAAIVRRGLGDKPGDEVVDSALTSDAAIRERGRQLINANDSDRIKETGTVVGTSFMRPGKVVRLSTQKNDKNIKLETFSLSVRNNPFSITSSVRGEGVK